VLSFTGIIKLQKNNLKINIMASARITMGNDEFILYIRKNHKCSLSNDQLGKFIWEWILKNSPVIDKVKDIVHDVPCHWGDAGTFIDPYNLPKTASQMTFERSILPELYDYLDTL